MINFTESIFVKQETFECDVVQITIKHTHYGFNIKRKVLLSFYILMVLNTLLLN